MAKKPASRPAVGRTATPVRQKATVAPAGNTNAAALRAAFSAATKSMGTAFKAAREVEDSGGTYEDPDIPKGKWCCQLVSARVDAPQIKKGANKGQYAALMELRFVVKEAGDYAGTQLRKTHWLSETEYRTLQEAWERLFKDLQRLGFETKGMEPGDLFQVAEELNKNQPYVLVATDPKTAENGNVYLNVYVNKLVNPDDYELAE